MEKPSLPNSTIIIVFGILSILTCCCWGVLGLIFGILAVVMAKRAKEIHLAEPGVYKGYNNVKIGRILGIIGIILSVIYLILIIVAIATYGWDGIQEMSREWMETGNMRIE